MQRVTMEMVALKAKESWWLEHIANPLIGKMGKSMYESGKHRKIVVRCKFQHECMRHSHRSHSVWYMTAESMGITLRNKEIMIVTPILTTYSERVQSLGRIVRFGNNTTEQMVCNKLQAKVDCLNQMISKPKYYD
tara:strand:+ start:3155 stop:3559 length:405 start_codon:yes stop_codon:yes gene_type:complete